MGKPPEVVDCKKRKFGLQPKCLKKDLSQRIRKLEANVKKLRTIGNKKQVKGFNLYKKKMDQLSKNLSRYNNLSVSLKEFGDKMEALEESLKDENKNITTSFNKTLEQMRNYQTNMKQRIAGNENMIQTLKTLVDNLNQTIMNQNETIKLQEARISKLTK